MRSRTPRARIALPLALAAIAAALACVRAGVDTKAREDTAPRASPDATARGGRPSDGREAPASVERAATGPTAAPSPSGDDAAAGRTLVRVDGDARIVEGRLAARTGGDRASVIVIGVPGGASFALAADDGRLRAVRRGEFVATRAVAGALEIEPLGELVWTPPSQAGALEITADGVLPPGRPLRRSSVAHWSRGGLAGVAFELVDAERGVVAEVEETHALEVGDGTATCTRRVLLRKVAAPFRLRVHAGFGDRAYRQETERLPEAEFAGAARHALIAEDGAPETRMTIVTAATCASFVGDAVDFEIPARWDTALEIAFELRAAPSER